MKDSQLQLIEVAQLRVGMFVHLDLGWTEHPFPFNSFKIRSEEQIETIRSLGLDRLRYSPAKSDVDPADAVDPLLAHAPPGPASSAAAPVPPDSHVSDVAADADAAREADATTAGFTGQPAARGDTRLLAQQASLERCERQFSQAARGYRALLQTVHGQPDRARAEADRVIDGMLAEIAGEQDVAIRLLSEKAGEESALHALNCAVLSMLLAKACGLCEAEELHDIGAGAMLHDIGKLELPDQLRWRDQHLTAAERRLYQEHVAHGVLIAERMGVPAGVREIIAQHHEYADGSGYPRQLRGTGIGAGTRIVSLVNCYDNLCNPGNPATALTPHEALAVMFARMRGQFDAATMAIFIRMMGVFPPGSTIQLTDGRYGLSVSVNAARPLKPRIIVYQPEVPPEQALLLDLERQPELGVQRSLKPTQLPRAVFDYLSPRKRMCYFFERSRDGGDQGAAA
jgi:putative nucleotidyltransferase with HDIG domain